MIKRFNKSKKSKKGAILVIVVLILALAMIFIASAMMLTQATRRRLYSRTMQSQARLTVTAASEVFLEALKTQEITDKQIDDILAVHSSRESVETNKAKMLVDGVPGMSSDPDNCTYIDIYKDDSYATNKKIRIDFTTVIGNDRENIQIIMQDRKISPTYGGRFSNQIEIGGNVANEELRFTYGVGMVDPNYITQLNSANTKIANKSDWLYVDDNTVLIRGNGSLYETASSNACYSDLVLSNGTAYLGGDNTYNGRIVILDSAVFSIYSGSTTYNGDMYFIGKGTTEPGIKTTTASWETINSKNFIFSGRDVFDSSKNTKHEPEPSVYASLSGTGVKCYIVDANGDAAASFKATYKTNPDQPAKDMPITNSASELGQTSSDTAVQNKRDEITHYTTLYRGYNYDTKTFPSDVETQVFNTINSDGLTKHVEKGETITDDIAYGKDGKVYKKNDVVERDGGDDLILNPLTKVHPSDATELKLSELSTWDTKYDTLSDRIIDLPAGNYYITGGSPVTDKTGGPYVIAINGSNAGSYRFWFSGEKHYLKFVVFAVYGANNKAPQPAIFILEQGANIQLGYSNDWADETYFASSGFISIARNNMNTAKKIGDYIHQKTSDFEDTNHGGGFKSGKINGSTHTITYSSYYTPKFNVADMVDESPKPAIYVLGVGGNTIGIGCANKIEAYMGLYNSGKFTVCDKDGGSQKTEIYGRLEADAIELKTAGTFCMPYCPAPSKSSSLPSVRPAETKYYVCDLIYYY